MNTPTTPTKQVVRLIRDIRKKRARPGVDTRVKVSDVLRSARGRNTDEAVWEILQTLVDMRMIYVMGHFSLRDNQPPHAFRQSVGWISHLPMLPDAIPGNNHYFDLDGTINRAAGSTAGQYYVLHITDIRVSDDETEKTLERLAKQTAVFSKRTRFGS